MLDESEEIIDNHFLHPLTIAQIAEQCFLSETKLKQGFKICFNCTVYEYIVEKRMEMAYRLLQSGKYKVKRRGMDGRIYQRKPFYRRF